MNKFVCIHGHFYQPPRENPWLEAIEVQDTARPYHDWNEKINRECYAPNSAARLLDGQGRILKLVNNYASISFNFGPTLLSWMEESAPGAYQAVVEADRESQRIRGGHGNALAQPYNHIIMPLGSRKEKRTQVIWGIKDFQHRFGRHPEGMWLPEAAVDMETLQVLTQEGIRFTILSPYQAKKIRKLEGDQAQDVSGGRIYPRRPYRCRLGAGQYIDIFFYDAPLSWAIAFGGLLGSGEEMARQFLQAFSQDGEDQLLSVATDGETYGHHRKFGEMALAYALNKLESEGLAVLTNYSQYLEKHPPQYEVEIIENSSWSCAHGVERWRADCGCKIGTKPQWNQKWRAPLRAALDWLKERADELYERNASPYLKDPWEARDDYIEVVLDRSPERINQFLASHQIRELDYSARTLCLELLEMQRHAMLMFTSCGWFFDEISGLETVQVLKYAGRALQLASEFFPSLEQQFLERLKLAPSNIAQFMDGAGVYQKLVKPAVVDLPRVVAHYGISSLFKDYPPATRLYCYELEQREYNRESFGTGSLTVGRTEIRSKITGQQEEMTLGLLHFADHDINCSIQRYVDQLTYDKAKEELFQAFASRSTTEVVRALDKHFGGPYYTLKDLFIEERRKILSLVTRDLLGSFDGTYRHIYEENCSLMEYLKEADAPLPRGFIMATEYLLNKDLEDLTRELPEEINWARFLELFEEAVKWEIPLATACLTEKLKGELVKLMAGLMERPSQEAAKKILELLSMGDRLNVMPDLWEIQNLFERVKKEHLPRLKNSADSESQELMRELVNLGQRLFFHMDDFK